MRNVKGPLLVGVCILLACSSSPTPAHDAGALDGQASQNDASERQDAPAADVAPVGPTKREDAATGPADVAAGLEAASSDAIAADLGGAELGAAAPDAAGADAVPWSCPAGFYAAGGGPGGGGLPCDPKAPPGILPCVRGRDAWCPAWCPALTICGPAGWVCCQGP